MLRTLSVSKKRNPMQQGSFDHTPFFQREELMAFIEVATRY